MKRVTLLCGLLLAMTAGVAAAGPGVNIKWQSCLGDGGLTNRNFACNANNPTKNILVCSFVTGEDILQSSGQEVVIDIASATSTLPAWWQFKNAGTCRQGALGVNTVDLGSNCIDWAVNGPATAGLGAYNIGERGPNTARIKIANAVQAVALADLLAGQEYFSVNVTVDNSKTVGTGACTGCGNAVCIVFNSIKLTTQVAANDRTLTGPTDTGTGSTSDFATWQGGGGVSVGGVQGCGAATPTKNATWGAVKALYH